MDRILLVAVGEERTVVQSSVAVRVGQHDRDHESKSDDHTLMDGTARKDITVDRTYHTAVVCTVSYFSSCYSSCFFVSRIDIHT